MTAADYDALRTSVIAHEGFRSHPYPDTTGHLTIGYGRNLTDDGISGGEAALMLDHDLERAVATCQAAFPWFNDLDGARQRVLAEMAYNLGIGGLLEFTKMLSAAEHGLYVQAASEMLRSKWALQVGSRARRLASLMQTGSDTSLAIT